MRMRRKAGVRRDLVVVPDAQRADAHALRIIIIGEGEMVLGIEPAMVGAAQAFERSAFDHVNAPFGGGLTRFLVDHALAFPANL